jgi:hypothetical protein
VIAVYYKPTGPTRDEFSERLEEYLSIVLIEESRLSSCGGVRSHHVLNSGASLKRPGSIPALAGSGLALDHDPKTHWSSDRAF